eukprot:scaffold102698_cov57-Phaeocystis_antarctica.AAC.1
MSRATSSCSTLYTTAATEAAEVRTEVTSHSVRGCGKSAIRTLCPKPALSTTMSAPVAAAMMMARAACLARAPRMIPAVRRAAPRRR